MPCKAKDWGDAERPAGRRGSFFQCVVCLRRVVFGWDSLGEHFVNHCLFCFFCSVRHINGNSLGVVLMCFLLLLCVLLLPVILIIHTTSMTIFYPSTGQNLSTDLSIFCQDHGSNQDIHRGRSVRMAPPAKIPTASQHTARHCAGSHHPTPPWSRPCAVRDMKNANSCLAFVWRLVEVWLLGMEVVWRLCFFWCTVCRRGLHP